MTLEEKLQLAETIWANIAEHHDDLPSPAWHEEVLRERERQVEAGEVQFNPWEQAKANLRRRAAARKQSSSDSTLHSAHSGNCLEP